MTVKEDANKKNQSNQNQEKMAFLKCDVHPDDKNRWVRNAKLEGKKLQEWVTETLNKACK